MIAVFISNKLISCDTIVPLLLEVKHRAPKQRIELLCFDRPTCEAIRSSIVLWEAIQAIGRFRCLGRTSNSSLGIAFHRLKVGAVLLALAARAFFGTVFFIHFKALNTGPLRLLGRLNRKRTLLFESNCWGYRKLMIERVGNLGLPRTVSSAAGLGNYIVGFSEGWPELFNPGNADKKRYVIPSSHRYPQWINFVHANADRLFEADFRGAGLSDGPAVVVFVLGYFGRFGFFEDENTGEALFHDTLEALAEASNGLPVFIKPHAITDIDTVRKAVGRYGGEKFVITNLHPTLLATRAAAFVCNYYSTTLADAASMGVPTVEFTRYTPETLAVTKGGSMRPEYVSHFINGEPAAFRELIGGLTRNIKARRPEAPVDTNDNPVLALLAG